MILPMELDEPVHMITNKRPILDEVFGKREPLRSKNAMIARLWRGGHG